MVASGSPTVARERVLAPGMRWLLVVAGVLVMLAGVQLFLLPLRTATLFAWTVGPPMTAVFLGASYWAAAAVEWTAATRRTWAEARVAVPGVFLFTTLTLIVTVVHLDRFHLGAQHAANTQLLTWAWFAIYALVPILMAVLWVRQSRAPGVDPPRARPLPRDVRGVSIAQAMVLIPLGSALLVAPARVAEVWPWSLTPLTGRAVGAWVVSLGVIALQVFLEDDVDRARPAANGALAFAVLQSIALVRHGGDLTWGPAAVGYVLVVASFLVIGTVHLRRPRHPGVQ